MSNHMLVVLFVGVVGWVVSYMVLPDGRNQVDWAARRERRRRLVAGLAAAGLVSRAA
jgi:hypothetical protein